MIADKITTAEYTINVVVLIVCVGYLLVPSPKQEHHPLMHGT